MQCYELATPRIKKYLDAELDFALSHISEHSNILDIGCGYGRTLPPIAAKAKPSLALISLSPISPLPKNSFALLRITNLSRWMPPVCSFPAILLT